jgi:internalin A
MDIIRAEFERIHATIPRLTVEEKVPIPDQPSVVVDYSHLLDLFELGESSFVPEKSKQRYEVRALLEGIETAERRQERQEDILERRGFTARRRPVEPTADPPISIWRIGIFFLTALVLTIIVLGGTGYFVGGATLSLIMIGAVIILCLIGAFVALMAGKLSEKNTVALISNALARLSLLRTSERKGVAAR